MSKQIDERVLSMQFDNKHFENNVQTTLSTLDKLKQRLNLSGAAKGLQDIGTASKNVDMSGLGGAVDTLHAKFSTLQVMGVTALANITNSAVNAGKRIVSALTIDPIKTGFSEYETKINSIQTIMSNTASKGTTMADVTKVIDELNTYADKTIYNFAEMTRNIGTFTAAGVGLEESAKAIQGIANLAAASGSNSQQASTAMYQLSQALATGTVKLMDWNSVVNAGMGGEKFQEALKATAREHGVAVDEIVKNNGSFRDSLQEGWLSADILNETLSKFTVDGAAKYAKSMMESGKWTQAQADALMKEANAMEDAATKVKTFTQLWDTLKESAQSGWGKTWEIIVGDFDEAKTLLTEVSDVFGGLIGQSADTRNKMLEGWKDLGGRTALVESFRNMFEGIGSVIKPISEAFREIFPSTTSNQLYSMTKALQTFTEKLKIGDTTAKNLKNTFKGLFAAVDIVVEVIKAVAKGAVSLISHFTGIQNGVLGLTGAFGNGISGLRDYIVETDLFGGSVEKVTNFVGKIIDKIKEFGSSLKNAFKESSGFENLSKMLSSIFDGFGNIDFERGLGLISQGLFAGILLGIQKFVKGLTNPFEGVSGVLENITGILDDVRGCFEAYQQNLQAGTLLKIASAIGILAASILVISTIDPDALGRALMALTVMFAQLLGSLALFTKITTNFVGVTKAIGLMMGMSIAVSILAGALKKMSSIDTAGIIRGLVAITVMMELLTTAALSMNGKEVAITKFAGQMLIMSGAITVLAFAMKSISNMSWSELAKGVLGLLSITTMLTIAAKMMNGKDAVITKFAGQMLIMSGAITVLAYSLKTLSSLSWSGLAKGLLGLLGIITMLVSATKIMGGGFTKFAGQMLIMSGAITVLVYSLKTLSSLSWGDLAKGGIGLVSITTMLTLAAKMMDTQYASITRFAGQMLIMSTAIGVLAMTMKSIGNMSWSGLAKGLIGIAGAFAVIGVAGALLAPLTPALLGLSGAFALFGLATLGIGAGLSLVGIGLSAVATGLLALVSVGTLGATTIVAALKTILLGVISMIPALIESLGQGVIMFFKTVSASATVIADSVLVLLTEVLASLVKYTPQIVEYLMQFFIGIFDAVANKLPELIKSAVNLIGSFFSGIVDALGAIDPDVILKGTLGVGLLAGLMAALSAIVGMIPGAMIGVLGVGVVVAELALVLAAIGALSKIPGLSWLIEEGGNFLQLIGTAIGQFIGGIAGGFMSGVSSQFPKIGSDLSKFMTNLKPFIDGAKSVDSGVAKGMGELAKAILLVTAVDVVNGISSWLTGGNSMAKFAEQLVPFGKGLKKYSKSISGIDSKTVQNSATAAEALVKLAKKLPKEGGLKSLFTGSSNLADFAEQLIPFGKSMKSYGKAISGIDSESITNSSTAAKALVALAKDLPNTGGLSSWFAGDNTLSDFGSTLVPFGKGLKDYSKAISGLDSEAITNSATAAKALSELANNLPNSGGVVSWFAGDNDLSSFGEGLVPFGKGLKDYSKAIAGIDSEAITNSAVAAKALSKLSSDLPNSGGLVSWFTGDNDISSFGARLVPFGRGLKLYSLAISGIDSEAITNSATAAKSLSELAKKLPEMGGLFSVFTGDQDMGAFGRQLVPFGEGLKEYSISVTGMDAEAVKNSSIAVKALAVLAENLPSTGGLLSWFSGEQDMVTFGSKLVPFGKSLKDYASSVTGMDAEAVNNSSIAVKALAALAENLPSTGGIISWFSGDNDLSSFGSKLVPFGKSLKDYATSVTGIDPNAVTNSTTAAKSLVALAENLPNTGGLVSLFTGEQSMTEFAKQLAPFGKGLKAYSDSVVGIDSEAVSNASKAVKALSSLAESIPTSGGIFSWFTGDSNISDFGSNLVPFGKGLKAYSDSVAGINAEAVNASTAAAKKLVSLIKSMDGLSTAGAQSFRSAINTLAQTNIQGFINAFDGQSSKLQKIGTNMSESIIKGLESKNESFTSTTTKLVSAMAKVIKDKYTSFTTLGSDLIKKFISGIDKNKDKAKSAVSTLVKTASANIRTYYNSFYESGEYLVAGFAAGISANSYKAEAKAKAMANAAATAAKKALKEKSPSKVFFGIGKFAGEGFINALDAYRSLSAKAGSRMAESARLGLSNAISNLSDIISSDMDTQPIIRPVIDLSDVTDSVGTLNSMFSMNPSVGVLARAKSISSMMNKNQNGVNDELISEIKDLKKSMGNNSGDTYIIDGITYDDGSNVSDAVKTLIRASRVERRK